jgi:hypothetical protein
MIWDDMDHQISINNKYIGIIQTNKLLSHIIQVPNIQRIRDNAKITEIVAYQQSCLQKTGACNFLGVINIHFCKETGDLYIVDGQHRFESIKIISQLISFPVSIEIVVVDTLEQLRENYNMINKNTPLPEFPETIDKSIPEKVAMYFHDKYPAIWSKNSRARRPHIYFNFFQEALGVLTERLQIKSAVVLQQIIEDHNTKISQWSIEQYPDSKNVSENIIKKCKETGFYLGIYNHISDDYRYEWVKEIIHIETGIIVKKAKSDPKKRTSVPGKVRCDSWNRHVGSDKGEVLCLCCRETTITALNFEAGHVLSVANGGTTDVDNIRPICSGCNKSMSTTSMDQYIQTYYPKNIDFFKTTTYLEPNKKATKKWSLFS